MPYNTSPNTVKRLQRELRQLVHNEKVIFESEEPHKLAYLIREAIYAAVHHNIEPFCHIDYTFKVRDGQVLAQPKSLRPKIKIVKGAPEDPEDTPEDTDPPEDAPEDTPEPEPSEPEPSTREITRECSEFDVIQEASHIKPKETIKFPFFNGSIQAVESWTSKRNLEMSKDPLAITSP